MPTGSRPVLLLTRPEADSRRFAAMLPEFRAVISPILRIVPVEHDASRLAGAEGLIFTSGHAVASAGAGRGRLAICVGRRTAEIAAAAGFTVQHGNGFAESLIPLIEAAPMPLIHPHGRHLARRLPVTGMVVYDQLALPLNDQAVALLQGDAPLLLPLFSPRSSQLVSAAVVQARAPLWPVAISPAAMAQWRAPAQRQAVAATADIEAMADACRSLAVSEQS
ncbi:uroporphyrinogen-III synthase [Paracoccus alcaliphilus]|uniref:Uroporphyrinogen-III synthase n=1 Tax=Paracoccus alcaliphilus TaxID=34002 RepID=A0A1H8ITA0_9RHOB|nr:uroporphyrinogen-III synthase [Paracoccus alcaliphilus]WCR18270.1 uroporphyrinogen-III synthase [Paracoccus alcaliphilus]SEN71672.1 uroporphyrinogen-III synthase [Paracoccus alcaliphilus]